MNLVFITDAWQPLTGGGQKLYWEVLSRLAEKHGWKITVVTRALRYNGRNYQEQESLLNGSLTVVRLPPALSFFHPWGRFIFIWQAWIYCFRLKPDVFMATTWLPAISLQLLKLFNRRPTVLLAIGFGSKFKWLENVIAKRFNYDLVITDDWQFKKAKFIPNGVDLPQNIRVKKSAKFTFLFVGRNEPRKGVEYLRQAFNRVRKIYPRAQLKIFGPGFKLISQQQLNQEMFKAHCLVLPSLREGHPLILFEAWAHRLPVIATDVGSVAQFINEKNGYLVTAGNSDALSRAMIKAIENKNLNAMGEAGFDLVKNYTWDKTAASYDLLLRHL